MADLERLVGELCCITYAKGGEELSKVGRVLSVDSEFVEFKTRHNRYVVHRSAIRSIKARQGDANEF